MDLERLRAGHWGVITKLSRELDETLTSGTATGEKVGCFNVQLQNKLSALHNEVWRCVQLAI